MTTSTPRRVAILGSTGSIGTQALEVIAAHPEDFDVVALSAGSNAALLAEQARSFNPETIGLHDEATAAALEEKRGNT